MTTLRQSVQKSVDGMTWLKPTDQAAVDLALTYANVIDAAIATGEPADVTKALYLGPHLLNALKAIGGTPADRRDIGAEEAVGGKLAQLRSIGGGKQEAGDAPKRTRKAAGAKK